LKGVKVIKDIKELDDTGLRMRASWKKLMDYSASFMKDFAEVYPALKSGDYGSDWWPAKWLVHKVNAYEDEVLKFMKAFQELLTDDQQRARDEAEQVQRDLRRQERERKQAEADARRAAAQAERKRRDAEKAAARAVRDAEKAAAKAKREADAAALKAQRDADAAERKQQQKKTTRNKGQNAKRAVRRVRLASSPPEDTEMVALLARLSEVGVSLGEVFWQMRNRVQLHKAGRDGNGEYWKWKTWVEKYITNNEEYGYSYATVMRRIADYEKNPPNVVPLRPDVAV